MMNGSMHTTTAPRRVDPADMQRDIAKINGKSADQLAESIEIMVLETRPLDYARTAMRGACCWLRGEPTKISKSHAIHALTALKDRWEGLQWPQRALIVKRAIDLIHTSAGVS